MELDEDGVILQYESYPVFFHQTSKDAFGSKKCSLGVIGVNQWKKKWGQSLYDECPVCLRPNESATHVIHCPDDRVNDQWMRSLSKLAL